MLNVLLFSTSDFSSQAFPILKSIPCRVFSTSDYEEFTELAAVRVYDVWIIALRLLPSGKNNLSKILHCAGEIPVILLVPPDKSDEMAICLVDYQGSYLIRETATVEELALAVKRAAEEKRLRDEILFLQGESIPKMNLGSIITRNSQMEHVLRRVKDVALTDATVLIQGETGTGKELLARTIHAISHRKNKPFVAVNCSAFPDTLIESELFGHERGAFTGAASLRIGKFEYAQGGSFFLDEVETMSMSLQVKLLRVLHDNTIQRLGSNKDIPIDFRLIVATNEDLLDLVQSGRFRRDLFYRLMVVPLQLPPLRHRQEDIPFLATHFLHRTRVKGRKYVKEISKSAMEQLMAYSWPGNVRELKNVVERAVILEDGEEISDFGLDIQNNSNPNVKENSEPAFMEGKTLRAHKMAVVREAERRYLVELLQHTEGRIAKAARLAGLTPRAINEKMRYHGLHKEDYRQPESKLPIGSKSGFSLQ